MYALDLKFYLTRKRKLSDLSQYRPLYAPKDFLEVLFSIRDPSFKKQPCVVIDQQF